jgi:hypothetical protein
MLPRFIDGHPIPGAAIRETCGGPHRRAYR